MKELGRRVNEAAGEESTEGAGEEEGMSGKEESDWVEGREF